MSRRWTTWLALGLWLLEIGLIVSIGVMKAAGWEGAGDTSDSSLVAILVAFFAFATMGALVAARVPRNPVGWIFLAIALGAGWSGVAENVSYQGLVDDPGSIPGAIAAGWAYAWMWYPTVGLIAFVLLLFPTGAPPGRFWRLVAWTLGLLLGLVTVAYMTYPGPLDGEEAGLPDNPLGVAAVGHVVGNGDAIVTGSLLTLVLLAMTSVVVRFWRSRGDERQQLKWMTLAAVFLAAGLVVPGLLGIDDAGDVFFALSVVQLPVALGIAMFKYRLYDVDRLINKTLVYGLLTVLLGAAYAGLVLLGQEISASVAGGGDLAIAVSTLAVAALFLPLRRGIQRFVDRRFYRRRYDAQLTIQTFGARLREQVDLGDLSTELCSVVVGTMQPAHASVWLREAMR